MKKSIFGLVVLMAILGLLLGGCVSPNSDYYPSENIPTNDTPSTPDTPAENTPTTVLDNPPPENVTWISPGKVNVANFYPGARAEYPITIHNGNDVATEFLVSYRSPDNVATGYARPIVEVQDWVIIADMTPILAPHETREIMVALVMPNDAIVFAGKWEFWISVKDNSQTGTIKTELCLRWIIDMRGS